MEGEEGWGCLGGRLATPVCAGTLAQFPGRLALPRIPGVGVPMLLAQAWVAGILGSWDPGILPALTLPGLIG